jgi:hypothetical protein
MHSALSARQVEQRLLAIPQPEPPRSIAGQCRSQRAASRLLVPLLIEVDTTHLGRTEVILADPEVLRYRVAITGGNAPGNEPFALYLVDWFVRRVYQEIDGTLDDSIPRAP